MYLCVVETKVKVTVGYSRLTTIRGYSNNENTSDVWSLLKFCCFSVRGEIVKGKMARNGQNRRVSVQVQVQW